MTSIENEFSRLCERIVRVTYEAVGTRLSTEEIVELASELATEIMLTFQAASEPVPSMAGEAMEKFFRGKGIADVGDNRWHWMN